MGSLNFDPFVEHYDDTRVVETEKFAAAVRWLAERFPPAEFPHLLEPGVGTGRIAIPLAEQGYTVHGVDISQRMLAVLADRLAEQDTPLRVSARLADVLKLPFPSGSFDIVVVTHLFYFIREWKEAVAELLRALRAGGPMVLMHTGRGTEVPFVNDRYKEHCAAQGFPITPLGVSSTQHVADYLAELGCALESVRDRWQWTSHIRCDKAVSYMRSRAYSFTAAVPDDVHASAVRHVESQAIETYGSPTAEVPVENQIYFVIARR